MRKHISFRKNGDILRNYATSLGFNYTITVPHESTKIFNEDLKQYDAKLGFNYDERAHEAYGIWFETEQYYMFFLLRFS